MKISEKTFLQREDIKKEYAVKFGVALKTLLTREHLSQRDLSEMLGVSQNTISSYIKGTMMPTTATVLSVADHFNVSLDLLFNRNVSNEIKEKNNIEDLMQIVEDDKTLGDIARKIVSLSYYHFLNMNTSDIRKLSFGIEQLDKFKEMFCEFQDRLNANPDDKFIKDMYNDWLKQEIARLDALQLQLR